MREISIFICLSGCVCGEKISKNNFVGIHAKVECFPASTSLVEYLKTSLSSWGELMFITFWSICWALLDCVLYVCRNMYTFSRL